MLISIRGVYMKMSKKKGGFAMTGVMTLVNEYVIGDEVKKNKYENKDSKFEYIKTIISIKISRRYNRIIKNNIVKNKEIRNGKATLKGTRITPEELTLFVADKIEMDKQENKNTKYKDIEKYLFEEYPSISNIEQIKAALYYVIKHDINIFQYIFVILFLW